MTEPPPGLTPEERGLLAPSFWHESNGRQFAFVTVDAAEALGRALSAAREQLAAKDAEIARLERRNAELTASEEKMAAQLRVAEAGRKMVCGVNEQLNAEIARLERDKATLMEAVCRMAKPLTWSKEPPTEPGDYWLRKVPNRRRFAAQVIEDEGSLWVNDPYAMMMCPVEQYDGWEFAGPIPLPEEPSDG